MKTHSLKSLLLASLSLAPLAGCGGEALEPSTPEEASSLATATASRSSTFHPRMNTYPSRRGWSCRWRHPPLTAGNTLAVTVAAASGQRFGVRRRPHRSEGAGMKHPGHLGQSRSVAEERRAEPRSRRR